MKKPFNPDEWAPGGPVSALAAGSATPDPATARRARPSRPKAKAGKAAPATSAAPEPAAAPIAATPEPPAGAVAHIIGGPSRTLRVPLVYPVGYGVRIYTAITLRRPSGAEVDRYLDRVRGEAHGGRALFPIFFDDDGLPVPGAVFDALDADDDEAVFEHAPDFMPRRLQRFLQG